MKSKNTAQGSYHETGRWVCPGCEAVNIGQFCEVCGRAKPGQAGQKRLVLPIVVGALLLTAIAVAAVAVAMRDRGTEKITALPSLAATAPAAPSATEAREQAEQASPPGLNGEVLDTADELCTFVLTDNGWPAMLSVYSKDSAELIRSVEFTYADGRLAKTTLLDPDGYAIMSRELLYDDDGAAIGHIATDNRGNTTQYDAGNRASIKFYEYQGRTAENLSIWSKASQREYMGIGYSLYGEQEENHLLISFTPTGEFYGLVFWENGSRRDYDPDINLWGIWDYATDPETAETINILMLYFDRNELIDVDVTDGDYNDLPLEGTELMARDGAVLRAASDYVLCLRLEDPPEEWREDADRAAVLELADGSSGTATIHVNAEHIGWSGNDWALWTVLDPAFGITAADIAECDVALWAQGQEVHAISMAPGE